MRLRSTYNFILTELKLVVMQRDFPVLVILLEDKLELSWCTITIHPVSFLLLLQRLEEEDYEEEEEGTGWKLCRISLRLVAN